MNSELFPFDKSVTISKAWPGRIRQAESNVNTMFGDTSTGCEGNAVLGRSLDFKVWSHLYNVYIKTITITMVRCIAMVSIKPRAGSSLCGACGIRC